MTATLSRPADAGPADLCHPDCLRDADRETVLRQYAEHTQDLALPVGRENRTICRGLSRDAALDYLSKINTKLLLSRSMLSAFVAPWVVAWWIGGDSLGFPVEVWMADAGDGTWDIVDRSLPLYRLPWLFGMGWVLDG